MDVPIVYWRTELCLGIFRKPQSINFKSTRSLRSMFSKPWAGQQQRKLRPVSHPVGFALFLCMISNATPSLIPSKSLSQFLVFLRVLYNFLHEQLF